MHGVTGQATAVVDVRLRRQRLRPPYGADVAGVLRHLLAVQSQEFAYARWSIAQRTPGATADDVEQAVADGTILRTHILRPTWHFVHRDDLGWLMALSAERLHQGNKGMYRQTGVDTETAARSGRILAEAVAGGNHKTREELGQVLERAGLPGKDLGFIYHLMHAETSGILVSGAPVRSTGGALKQTYALFEERVPNASGLQERPGFRGDERDHALARLVLRYFGSRGPATVKDCSVWSGLTMQDIRRGLDAARSLSAELTTVDVDGVECHVAAEEVESLARSGQPARPGQALPRTRQAEPRIDLVQCYDEYIMGYSQTRHYLGGTAPFFPEDKGPMHAVLLDGRLAGWWRHRLSGGVCGLEVRMNREPGPEEQAALDAQAQRYGQFLRMQTSLV
ncbi:winged helix DNA-binding domain-containing protein [Paenarthrobacter sp. NCHU4564]|uniref:winged helix DNA-binding domain-containing protein n=1 Tax=Paenarthrobacter sp. NCHU4564 TaxID=3451353 RepID=UPI003F9E2493